MRLIHLTREGRRMSGGHQDSPGDRYPAELARSYVSYAGSPGWASMSEPEKLLTTRSHCFKRWDIREVEEATEMFRRS